MNTVWIPFENQDNEEPPKLGEEVRALYKVYATIVRFENYGDRWLVGLNFGDYSFDNLYHKNDGWLFPKVVLIDGTYSLVWRM